MRTKHLNNVSVVGLKRSNYNCSTWKNIYKNRINTQNLFIWCLLLFEYQGHLHTIPDQCHEVILGWTFLPLLNVIWYYTQTNTKNVKNQTMLAYQYQICFCSWILLVILDFRFSQRLFESCRCCRAILNVDKIVRLWFTTLFIKTCACYQIKYITLRL